MKMKYNIPNNFFFERINERVMILIFQIFYILSLKKKIDGIIIIEESYHIIKFLNEFQDRIRDDWKCNRCNFIKCITFEDFYHNLHYCKNKTILRRYSNFSFTEKKNFKKYQTFIQKL